MTVATNVVSASPAKQAAQLTTETTLRMKSVAPKTKSEKAHEADT
jgi:hypothetical protein